jgi:hypothetical protein
MKLHWGNAIVIFFALFLSLAAFFIVFSFRQNNDLEDDDYYEKGAGYSNQIEINNRSVVFNDSITITPLENSINFNFCQTILNNSGAVQVHFYRPSAKEFDYNISLNTGDSVFAIEKSKLLEGRYIVKLSWIMDNLTYAFEKDLMVK